MTALRSLPSATPRMAAASPPTIRRCIAKMPRRSPASRSTSSARPARSSAVRSRSASASTGADAGAGAGAGGWRSVPAAGRSSLIVRGVGRRRSCAGSGAPRRSPGGGRRPTAGAAATVAARAASAVLGRQQDRAHACAASATIATARSAWPGRSSEDRSLTVVVPSNRVQTKYSSGPTPAATGSKRGFCRSRCAVDPISGNSLGTAHACSCARSQSRLAAYHGHPSAWTRRSSSAFCTCSRFSACCHAADCGPSSTSPVISSPRCAGRQCRTIASGAASAMTAASTQ